MKYNNIDVKLYRLFPRLMFYFLNYKKLSYRRETARQLRMSTYRLPN